MKTSLSHLPYKRRGGKVEGTLASYSFGSLSFSTLTPLMCGQRPMSHITISNFLDILLLCYSLGGFLKVANRAHLQPLEVLL